jgi:hypothetical protein
VKAVSDKVDKELGDAVDKSTSEWADELEKGSAEIRDKVTKGLAESKSSVDGLASKIDEKGDEIENESWLSRAAHFVGGLVVGLLEGLWDLVKVVLIVVLVVIAVVVVALILGAIIGGIAGIIAVIGVIAAIAEFIAAIAGVLLVIAAVIVLVVAIIAIYQAITREDLTDYERGKLWGHAAFDVATIVFGEEIFGWMAKWFEGLRGAEDAAALARLKALVTDDALLERLLKLFDGDTARLETILGKAGNDAAGLEKVLILAGGDVGKTEKLLVLSKGNAAKLEELLKASDGDPDKLLELFKANGDDLAKVEDALKKKPGGPTAADAVLSPDLQALRAGLKDPKAIQQFDEKFAAAAGGDPAKPNPKGVENFRRYLAAAEKRGGGDLEQGLLKDFERDHAAAVAKPPFGEAADELPAERARIDELRKEVDELKAKRPDLTADLDAVVKDPIEVESKNLEAMENGTQEATKARVGGVRNNIEASRAELRSAQAEKDLAGIGREFTLDGTPKGLEVDVVGEGGKRWIQVKNYETFGTETSQYQDVLAQAKRTLRGAAQNPIGGATPEVVFQFPKGVTQEVVSKLAEDLAPGHVTIEGPIVKAPK